MFKLTTIFLVCIYGIRGQVSITEKCPVIESVKENFDLNKYMGRWYEAEKYFASFEKEGKCISALYSLNENGTVKVHNQRIDKITGKSSFIEGIARPAGAADEAKLIVKFPTSPAKNGGPYWVLDTDYDKFSVVWACVDLPAVPAVSKKYAWILTRERNPSEDTIKKAYVIFDKFNISKEELIKTDQTNCTNDE